MSCVKNEYSIAWNFGPKSKNKKRVLDLLNQMKKEIPNLKWIVKRKNNNTESNFLLLDSSLATNNLKWEPVLNFEETVNLTINWYKIFYENKKSIHVAQLNEYFKLATKRKASWIK